MRHAFSDLGRIALGVAALIVGLLGVVGLVMPVLPGIPLLLLAGWLAVKAEGAAGSTLVRMPSLDPLRARWQASAGMPWHARLRLAGWLLAAAVVDPITRRARHR